MKRHLLIVAAAALLSGCIQVLPGDDAVITTGHAVAPAPGVCPVEGGCGAAGLTRTWMPTGGPALAPAAFYPFCERESRLCDTVTGKKLVALNAALDGELRATNLSVNSRIRQREDVETVGRIDDWRLPERDGDCEDFAILKKKELMDRGWPASALLITVVRQRFSGEGHTVLTVRTSRGDLILDNLTNEVRTWSATPYRYFARQSQQATGEWVRIDGGAGSV